MVSMLACRGPAEWAEEHPLHGLQHIPGTEHHTGHRDQGECQIGRTPVGWGATPGPLECACQHHELTHKTVEPGKADGREGEEHEEGCKPRHLRSNTTKLSDFSRVVSLVDHADGGKEPRRRKAVVDQLQIGTFNGDRLEGKQAHHAEAHVADR